MSTVRKRSRIFGYISGTWSWWLNPNDGRSCSKGSEYCEDIVGNYMGENPFYLDRVEHSPCLMNGVNHEPWNPMVMVNLPVEWNNVMYHDFVSDGFFRDPTQEIASNHPGEPAVSIPNFLYELKDVPGMLRQAANRAQLLHRFWLEKGWRVSHARLSRYYSVKRLGEDYLWYHFGWAPFWSDIKDIIDLDEYVQKRKRQFKRVRNAELRVTGTLGTGEASRTTEVPLCSFGVGVGGFETQRTVKERWFSARYNVNPIKFTAVLDPSDKVAMFNALGGGDLPINIWNAIPWSWLTDWFFNTSALIELAGNRQGVQFAGAMIMTQTRSEKSVHATSKPSWMDVSVGQHKRVTKQRDPFQPTFIRSDAGYNIFRPSHLAVLASLKVTKSS